MCSAHVRHALPGVPSHLTDRGKRRQRSPDTASWPTLQSCDAPPGCAWKLGGHVATRIMQPSRPSFAPPVREPAPALTSSGASSGFIPCTLQLAPCTFTSHARLLHPAPAPAPTRVYALLTHSSLVHPTLSTWLSSLLQFRTAPVGNWGPSFVDDSSDRAIDYRPLFSPRIRPFPGHSASLSELGLSRTASSRLDL